MKTTRSKIQYFPGKVLIVVGMLVWVLSSGDMGIAGTYADSAHGDTTSGVNRPGTECPPGTPCPIGDCTHCHDTFASSICGVNDIMLFSDKEDLCEECHDADGPASTDIKSELNKTYHHPTHVYSGRHTRSSLEWGQDGAPFRGANRHAECADCHNPHTIGGIDPSTPTVHPGSGVNRTSDGNLIYDATFGSAVLQGVWGVEVSSWPAMWERPTSFAELRPANNPEYAEKEYQICLKCHSYYADHDTTGNTYRVARDFNPNNRSAHPVVVTSENQTGSELSVTALYGEPAQKGLVEWQMKAPWKANVGNNTMYCSDCHGNDAAAGPVGAHGSDKPYMLKSFGGGDNHYWPNKPDGNPWTLYNLRHDTAFYRQYLFCAGCHDLRPWQAWDDNPHGYVSHGDGITCTQCHQRSIHGGQMGRLIGGEDSNVTSYTKKTAEDDGCMWFWYSIEDCTVASGCSPH